MRERESMLQSSGTRFGEILFVFANFLRAYLVASKNFEPTLANLVCYWAKFHRHTGGERERDSHTGYLGISHNWKERI